MPPREVSFRSSSEFPLVHHLNGEAALADGQHKFEVEIAF